MILFLSFLLCAKSSRGWTWSGCSSGQLTPFASSPVMSQSPSSSSIFRLFSRQKTPSECDLDEIASQSTNFIRMNSPRVFHPSQSVAIINHSKRFNHRSGVIIAHHKHDFWRIRMNDSGLTHSIQEKYLQPEEEALPEPEAETFPSEPSTPPAGSRLFNPPVRFHSLQALSPANSDKARAPEKDDPIVAVNSRVEIYQHSKTFDGRHGVVVERIGDIIKVKMVDTDTISRFRR